MGSAGKGGGGKGGGGAGGKGKKGGGSSSSQVAMCFDKNVLNSVIAAFNAAVESGGLSDGCAAGLMRVKLDLTTAQQLLGTVALGLNAGVIKKKKDMGGLTVVGPMKTPGKGKKAG